MKQRIQINGIITFLATLLVAAFPFKFLRLSYTGSDELTEIIGLQFILLGQLLRISGRGFKSERSRDGGSLITDGPYGAVRNPMYLGIVLIGAGAIAMIFEWWVAFIFIVFFIVRYLKLIYQEEKKLRESFGAAYADYARRVPRLFPRLSILVSKDIVEYLPLRFAWVKKEIVSIAVLLVGVFTIESWEELKIRGSAHLLDELLVITTLMLAFFVFTFYLARRYENILRAS